MSGPSLKTSLYLQEEARRRLPGQGVNTITRPLQPEAEASLTYTQRNTVTPHDLAQILRTNVGDDEEHVDLYSELENLFGYYGRMN